MSLQVTDVGVGDRHIKRLLLGSLGAFFHARGLAPWLGRDGRVRLTMGAHELVYQVMTDGHACHSLVAEDIWVLSSSIERVQALEAAAVVNAQTQVVKVCPVGCRVSVRADMFGDAQAFIEGYDLLVGAIHSGADHFEYLMIKD